MDWETATKLAALRREASQTIAEHQPPQEQGENGTSPYERFQALGSRVMRADEFPRAERYTPDAKPHAYIYRLHVFLPEDLALDLIAETFATTYSSPFELLKVRTELRLGHVSSGPPLATEEISNVYENRELSDYDARKLALVEESFAMAELHIRN
jgi:hypothetical protein